MKWEVRTMPSRTSFFDTALFGRALRRWWPLALALSAAQLYMCMMALQNVGDVRLLDRSCINALKKMRESERYTKGMYSWIGFRKKDVEFVQGDRVAGESSWNYKQLFSFAIDGITSFTNAPLRISTIVGFFVSLFAFLYMIYVFIKALIWGDPVQGYPTLVILILFLGGFQLLSLGIIGEYIGRIYNETKNRPDYIVREFNDEKVI